MENMRARGRGRRGRARGRQTTRRKKSVERKEDLSQSPVEEDEMVNAAEHSPQVGESPSQQLTQIAPPTLDMEADISQLEAPTFTTLSRGPPEPMLRLNWGHAVNLIGEKVLNPMIHCCDTCLRPILIYGRMIPCKHVFCLACAHRDSKQCPRCNDKVLRVEQTGLGTVFMCNHGGSRYGNNGCRRTYLSQRDLQAHINHRHLPGAAASTDSKGVKDASVATTATVAQTPAYYQPPKVKLYDGDDGNFAGVRAQTDVPAPITVTQLPILRPSGNLITVPIQEPPPETFFKGFHQPPPTVPPPSIVPPMVQQPPPFFPPSTFDYPPPDTSVPPPPTQWPGNPQFY